MKSFSDYLVESKKLDDYIFEEEIIQEGFWGWLGGILAAGIALIGAGVAKIFKWMFSETEKNVKENGGEYKVNEKTESAITSGTDFKQKEVIVSAMDIKQTEKFLSITKSNTGDGPFNSYYKFMQNYDSEGKNKQENTIFVNYGKDTIALLFIASEDEKNFYIEHICTYQNSKIEKNIFSIVKDKIVEILKNTYKEFENLRVRFKDGLDYFDNLKMNKQFKAYVFPEDTGAKDASSNNEYSKLTDAQVNAIIKKPNEHPFTVSLVEPDMLKRWCDYMGKQTKSEKYYNDIVKYHEAHDNLIMLAIGVDNKIKEINESGNKKNLFAIGIMFIDNSDIRNSGIIIEKVIFIEELHKEKMPEVILTSNLYKAIETEMKVKIENIHISDDVAKQFNINDNDEHFNKINDVDIKEIDYKDFEKIAKENTKVKEFKQALDDYKTLTDEDQDIHVIIVCSKDDENQICYFALVYSDKDGKNIDIAQYVNPELKGAISDELKDNIKEKFAEFYNNLKEKIQNDKGEDSDEKIKPLSEEIIKDILNTPEKRPITITKINKDKLVKWCNTYSKDVGPETYYDAIKKYQTKHSKKLIYALQITSEITEAKDDKKNDNIINIGVAFVNKLKKEDKDEIMLSRIYFVNELLHDKAKMKKELLTDVILKPLAKKLSVKKEDIILSEDIKKQFDLKEENTEEVEEVKPDETKEIKKEIKNAASGIKLIADDIKETQFKAWIKNNDEDNNYFNSAVKYQEKHDNEKIFTIDLVKDDKPTRIGFLFAKVERDSESNAPSSIIINNIIFANKLLVDNKIDISPDFINNDICSSLRSWAREMGSKDDELELEISGECKNNFVSEGLDTDNLGWKMDAWFIRDNNQKELFNRVLNDPTTLEIALSDGFDMQGLVNFTYDNVKTDKEIDYVYQLNQLIKFLKDK